MRGITIERTDIIAVSPAILVLLLTAMMIYLTGYPEGLVLSRSIRGISTRFTIIILMLLAPLPILPRLLTWLLTAAGNGRLFGQLAIASTGSYAKLSTLSVAFFRPLQGIGLSLVFAEKLLQLIEFTSGVSSSRFLVRTTLFMFGNILVSLSLSIIWVFDHLGIKMYNKKTGEVRLLGSMVGLVLPLITGVIGITALFQHDTAAGALTDLLGISMVLYPPYSIFAFIHYQFFRRRTADLLKKLSFKRIETNVW